VVYIITGGVCSGKSNYLLAVYNILKDGDGFYNKKVFEGGQYIGQDIIRLSTGEKYRFSVLKNHKPQNWDEYYTLQEYSFSQTGLTVAADIINHMLDDKNPAFIDELGPLELCEKGLYLSFKNLLCTKKDIYVVVRNQCLFEILEKFNITEYAVI
jgi:nucleoside-triphosphatase THEP1